jgi:hypothetical protein
VTTLVELQGRLNPISIDTAADEVVQRMDDAARGGHVMLLLRKSGGKRIAINMMNVLTVEEEDAGELG